MDFEALPAGESARREALLEAFGEQLFQSRNERLRSIERILKDATAREKLGAIHAKPYDAVARLGEQAVSPGVGLCKAAIDNYIYHLLGMFTNQGSDLRVGPKHALRYRLVAEVIDVQTLEVVEHADINRNTEKALVSYFGRWLNRYASLPAAGGEGGGPEGAG